MTKCECDRSHNSIKHPPHECPNVEGIEPYNITDDNGVIVQRSVPLCKDCHGIYAFKVDGSDGPAELRGKPITDAPATPPPVLSDGLTTEQSHANAKAIFPQTTQRIATLMQTLIQLTGNGDLAIWAVIDAMDTTIRGLSFPSVPHLSRQQFLGCAELLLSAYATRMADYRRAWDDYEVAFALTTKAGTTAPEVPELPLWTDADTLAIYTQMDVLYGPPKESKRVEK